MARRHVSSFTRGPRRAVDWSASSVIAGYTGLAGSTAALSEVFTPIPGGETVIRTRGLLSVGSDQVAATEDIVGAFGIAVVTAQAVSVGITAVPHPGTDAAWGGWLYHTFFAAQMRFASAIGLHPDWVTNTVIDSKAMRKVDEDERLVVVIENMATTGLLFFHSERFLSKIH